MPTERVEISTRPDDGSPPVCLTAEAAVRLGPLLGDGPERRVLRVGVEPGGCMGLRYVVSLVSPAQAGDDDLSLESEGVRVLVDPAAQTHLRGVTIDFTDEGFSVRNPHARGACACGASFADDLPAARG